MKIFGLSDIGKKRRENQDCFAIQELSHGVLAVVCDGMGGEAAGRVASEAACKHFISHASAALESSKGKKVNQSLITAADCANREVYKQSVSEKECAGMGTTLVSLYAADDGVTVLNIGDSEAYRISDSVLTKLTHDHSLVQEMVDNGQLTKEQAKRHPQKNIITRVIGGDLFVRSDLFESDAKSGDVFLLCSDGLTNTVDEKAIVSCCNADTEPDEICRALINKALDNGAKDNVTVVVLIYEREAAENEQ